jgi:predicted DNA-binding transcriptional regulator AlpA
MAGTSPRTHEPSIYMDTEQVLHAVQLGLTTWWALINAGDAPRPRQVSKACSRWLRREINEWCESRPVADQPPPPNAGKGRTTEARARHAARAGAANCSTTTEAA